MAQPSVEGRRVIQPEGGGRAAGIGDRKGCNVEGDVVVIPVVGIQPERADVNCSSCAPSKPVVRSLVLSETTKWRALTSRVEGQSPRNPSARNFSRLLLPWVCHVYDTLRPQGPRQHHRGDLAIEPPAPVQNRGSPGHHLRMPTMVQPQ